MTFFFRYGMHSLVIHSMRKTNGDLSSWKVHDLPDALLNTYCKSRGVCSQHLFFDVKENHLRGIDVALLDVQLLPVLKLAPFSAMTMLTCAHCFLQYYPTGGLLTCSTPYIESFIWELFGAMKWTGSTIPLCLVACPWFLINCPSPANPVKPFRKKKHSLWWVGYNLSSIRDVEQVRERQISSKEAWCRVQIPKYYSIPKILNCPGLICLPPKVSIAKRK